MAESAQRSQASAPARGGNQRGGETPLTGDTLTKVQAAALAEVGSEATVIRAETDADGNAAHEVHMVKDPSTRATVYVDGSFNVVSVRDQPAGGPAHHRGLAGPSRDHPGPPAPWLMPCHRGITARP